jgi:hypothetical protein
MSYYGAAIFIIRMIADAHIIKSLGSLGRSKP